MSEAGKIGNLLRDAYGAGEYHAAGFGETFEAWLADNGDEVLAAVAELAAQVRAQQAQKVRALAGCYGYQGPVRGALTRLADDIEAGTL